MAYSVEADGGHLARQALEAQLTQLAASDRNLLGRRPKPEEIAARLKDPAERFELLAQHWRKEAGEEAALPGESAAVAALKKKERTPEGLTAANAALEEALAGKHPVTTEQLEALGKARAQAIPEALLAGGQVDPARVFLISSDSLPPAEGGKVKLELSLK
jgi:hypothetical protein